MAWRLARSLAVLEHEIQQVAPGTTYWTIGDEDHQDDWSDHNPNECCDVVCAADILGNAGLDLAWLVSVITATDPPALKYVIYRDRIWFPQTGWQPYGGRFHSHVHVSVGWGPDGRSTGPYDDESPWGLLEEDDMPLSKDDVKAIWRTDGVIRAPGDPEEGNQYWTGESYLQSIRFWARHARLEAIKVRRMVATLTGEDVEAEVRTAIREEFAVLTEAAVAAVREAVPEANQDTAEAALRAVLGSLDETAA